jgi:hypothetical protein
MGDKYSEEAAQRQTVWRHRGMPLKFKWIKWIHSCQTSQKQPKPRGLKKWFLYICGYLALKPYQTQTHIF